MNKSDDARLLATRENALNAALDILLDEGIFGITHASISKATQISRSTLYRHWPEIAKLRVDAFKFAAKSPAPIPEPAFSDGPLRVDLHRTMSRLMAALNDSPWGKIAPHVIAAAASDKEAKMNLTELMHERIEWVASIFEAAIARGELRLNAPTGDLAEMAIAVPYFRKFTAGLPLDQKWLDAHVELLCCMAEAKSTS